MKNILFLFVLLMFPIQNIFLPNLYGEEIQKKTLESTISNMKNVLEFLDNKKYCPKQDPFPNHIELLQVEDELHEKLNSLKDFVATIGNTTRSIKKNTKEIVLHRKLLVEQLLASCELIRNSQISLNKKIDPNTRVSFNIYPPNSSYPSNISPDAIKEDDIKDAYKILIWNNFNLAWQQLIYSALTLLKPEIENITVNFIIRAYSSKPTNNNEIQELLEKSKCSKEMRVDILAELGMTYEGFRRWKTQNGRFKMTAKFISYDGQRVVLEKQDKKRETVVFFDLREEDQKYIKEQTKEKEEKR
jgi:hypothetical protein